MDTGRLTDTLRTKMGTLCDLFSMRANDPSFIRLAVLTGMVASLALMSAKVLLYRPVLAIPGGAKCSERQACLSWIDFLSNGRRGVIVCEIQIAYFFCRLLSASFSAVFSASAAFTFTSGSTPVPSQLVFEMGLTTLMPGTRIMK
jgi:hypothetical protein